MTTAATALAAVLDHVDAGLDQSLDRLKALLRIKSISTDPAFADECKRAAQLLVDDLAAQGFDRLRPPHARPSGGRRP